MQPAPSSIELLAPAGNWDCARAAVENGADAIYFGLDAGFNARARATNFHLDDLPDLVAMLHRQAVRGYVTLNTLVFTDEFPQLEENVRRLAEAGVDAVLVQDLGVARLVRAICPELQVHASTQMTLTNAQAIQIAAELGLARVVLARELSLKEIRAITAQTELPVEVFVHGALCVAYSGQCLTSESFGGRSANRGQCAQACRLPYDLYCDGQQRDLGDVRYLLSPQDLAAHDLLPQLIDAGVSSLKIEGRLKTPEYVANVCQHYRAAIDDTLRGHPRVLREEQKRELEMSFSRGFSPGWLEGCDHKRLVPGTSSSKRGVLLGTIVASRGDTVDVELVAPVAKGDGIVLQGDRFADAEIGSRVYDITALAPLHPPLRSTERPNPKQRSRSQSEQPVDCASSGQVRLGLQRGTLTRGNVSDTLVGLRIWKTDDPQLTKRLRRSYQLADPNKRVPVSVHARVVVGQPIQLTARVADAEPVRLVSEHVAEAARKHPLIMETLQEQFGRLGASVYRLEDCQADLVGNPMVPLSVLGGLRKQLIEALDAARQTTPKPCAPAGTHARLLQAVTSQSAAAPTTKVTPSTPVASTETNSAAPTPALRLLCRSLRQLHQGLELGVRQIIADFHDLREYRQAVTAAKAANAEIELATLRIHKPGEDGLFKAMAKHPADAWLVRNLAAVHFCQQQQIPWSADFSLNVTNPLTAEQLKQWGARRITASYDLNRDQLLELIASLPSHWMEVVVHQHMPMFHMEHCVFCSVLSPGKNKSDCGRPCDRHAVQLRDRVGAAHVLHADIGCRNTLYNGTAQSGAEAVRPLVAEGVRSFRIELLQDAPDAEVAEIVQLYRDLLDGKLQGEQVWQRLKAQNRVGVTRGTLEQPRNPLAIL